MQTYSMSWQKPLDSTTVSGQEYIKLNFK